MLSLGLLLGAVALSALVGYVTYLEDKARGQKLPFRDVSLMSYLQDSHHWHSFGHYFMDMSITFVSCLFAAALINLFNSSIVPLSPWFTVLCALPATLLTLYIEIVHDGHWRAFLGREPWMATSGGDVRDFLFDVFTHVAGSGVAILLIIGYWNL